MNIQIPKGEVEGWLSGGCPEPLEIAGRRAGPADDDDDDYEDENGPGDGDTGTGRNG